MPTIEDVSIIDSNLAEAVPVDSGLERTICSPEVCGSKNLLVYRRTVLEGRQLNIDAGDSYHIVYVMDGSSTGSVTFDGETNVAEEGAGVLLTPGESAASNTADSPGVSITPAPSSATFVSPSKVTLPVEEPSMTYKR